MSGPFDPTRESTIGGNDVPKSRIIDATIKKPLLNTFEKGVIIEVLGDPTTRNDEFFAKFNFEEDLPEDSQEFKNQEDLAKAPRNSLIVRPINNGKGRDDTEQIVCFPFFSSHMMLPVKPGETIWYMYPTPEEKSSRAYWLTRVCDLDHVEDVNFTHHDRRHDEVSPDPDEDRLIPSLHNGGIPRQTDPNAELDPGDEENFQTFEDPKAFADIRSNSLESKRFNIEPVPRITKKPGDLVLQGSNNTAIILGTDYGFSLTNRPSDKPEDQKSIVSADEVPPAFQGSIDLVAGRGRIYNIDDLSGLADTKDPPAQTRPRVVKNAEGDFETDKNTANDSEQGGDEEKEGRVNLTADPNEGDPDFINDSSRIYISMQTDVDDNFGTTIKNIPEAYIDKPDDAESPLQDVKAAAAIALKSDEIRIVARKTKDENTELKDAEYEDVPEINGSIRIIKEGDPKTDAACIYLLPDGTVQITGSRIMIGRSTIRDEGTAKHSAKNDKDEDVAVAEPYMRYTEFTTWASGLIDAINTAFANSQAAINANGDALDKAGNSGMTGGAGGAIPAPNAPLGAAFAQCIAPAGCSAAYDSTPDQDEIAKFKNTAPIKSKRIFGE